VKALVGGAVAALLVGCGSPSPQPASGTPTAVATPAPAHFVVVSADWECRAVQHPPGDCWAHAIIQNVGGTANTALVVFSDEAGAMCSQEADSRVSNIVPPRGYAEITSDVTGMGTVTSSLLSQSSPEHRSVTLAACSEAHTRPMMPSEPTARRPSGRSWSDWLVVSQGSSKLVEPYHRLSQLAPDLIRFGVMPSRA
jgi:hypothetical protein